MKNGLFPRQVMTPRRNGAIASASRIGIRLAALSIAVFVLLTGLRSAVGADRIEAARKAPANEKLNHSELARRIDALVLQKIRENEVDVSDRCTDAEFIRRVYLDIVGVIPPPDRVAAFLDDPSSDKRARLIDELLENPRYGKFFAEQWVKLMVPKVSNNRRLNNQPLRDWLADRLNKNVHWDKIVYDVITASGPQDKNGAVTFFIGNFGPEKVTNKVSQLFLGVQLQCAQCHDHPFTDWKQDSYWGMASFFQNVGLNLNPNQAAKRGVSPTIREYTMAELRASRTRRGKRNRVRLFRIPKDGKKLPPTYLLEGKAGLNPDQPYRPALAKWVTSKQNRFFARAIANKLWYHFFGRGIVNPVDDMHDDNPPTHPELLKLLEQQVKAHDFDLKYLIRAICNSETYQRSSRPKGNNADVKELYARALVRQLTPEQLYDSLEAVVKSSQAATKNTRRRAAKRRGRGGPREQFIAFFSGEDGYKPLDYQAGIPQALKLMNSRQFAGTVTVVNAMKSSKEPAQVIEYLYLATLSRRPTQAETQRLTQYVARQDNLRNAYGDVLWALLNSSEFALNH